MMGKRGNNAYVGIEKLKELSFSEAEVNLGNIHSFSLPKKDKDMIFTSENVFIGLKMEIKNDGTPFMMGLYEKDYHSVNGSLGDMVGTLIPIIKDCHINKKIICHFDDRDSTILMKVLTEYAELPDEDYLILGERITKGVQGKFHKKMGWIIPPLISVKLETGAEIGVISYLNGCLDLFYLDTEGNMYKAKTYNAKTFWQGDKKESARMAKLKYWEKIDETRHTQRQNFYQAKLACDLMRKVDKLFYREFNRHPKVFYSAGSLSESMVYRYLKTPTLYNFTVSKQMSDWQDHASTEEIANALHMFFDANKGGIIEHEIVGKVWYGGNADISSSYPAIMRYALPNLSGSTLEYRTDIKTWEEVPKANLKEVVLLTCEFNISKGVRHTIMVNDPEVKELEGMKYGQMRTSILGHGRFTATAHYHEVAFLLSQCKDAIVEIKEVAIIHTKGKLNPISFVIQKLWDLRMKLKAEGRDSEYIVKLIMNAIFGKLFQAYPQYSMRNVDNLEFIYEGFQAGFMFNPILSSIITAFARIRVQEGALNIEKNGGEVISILTDCVKYMKEDEIIYAPDLLDRSFPSILKDFEGLEENGWKEEKTLGWFEKPKSFENGLFMPKTAVYEYCLLDSMEEKWEVKTSGYQKFENKYENGPYIQPKLDAYETDYHEGLKFGKMETIKFSRLAEKGVIYKDLGVTRWRDMSFRVRENEMLPKREYKGEIELSLENLQDDLLFRTETVDLEKYISWEDGLPIDDRKMDVREIVVLISNEEIDREKAEKHKASRKESDRKRREKEKLLYKQVNENLKLLHLEKFTFKDLRTLKLDGTRELIQKAGLTPVI